MNVTVESLNSFTKKLSFELPAELVTADYDKVFKSVRSNAKVPGFRKGKVPRDMVEEQYAGVISDEVAKSLVNTTCFEALKTHRIIPISPPAIESDQVVKGQPFSYAVIVETYPEVELQQYLGLTVKKEIYVPDESAVDKQLTQLRESLAQLQPLEEDRPLETGDFAIIDFTGYLNDTPFEGGAGTDFQLQIGSGTFIAGFEEQLTGMKKGEERRITVTFPENYGNQQLSGNDAEFVVLLKEIKVKELAELNDELAHAAGAFETLEQLKEQIAEAAKQEALGRIEGEMRDRLQESLVELNPCEIPETLVLRQLAFLFSSMKHRLEAQHLTLDMIGMTEVKFNSQYRESAIQHVKEMLILHAIARKEGLTLAPEDLEKKYPQIAAQVGRDESEVKAYYEKDSAAMEHLAGQIVEEKVLAFLVEQSNIVEVSADELKK